MNQNRFFRNAMLMACAVFVLSSCGKDNIFVGDEDSVVSLKAAIVEGCNANGVLVIKNFETGKLAEAVQAFGCDYKVLKIVGNVPLNWDDYGFFHWELTGRLDLSGYTFLNNTIPDNAFGGSAIDVTLPKNIEKIGTDAFWHNPTVEEIDLPKVTEIGAGAFQTCISLTSVKLPKVKRILPMTFSECGSLVTIELKEATTLGANAFFLTSLKNVYMPSVNRVDGAFDKAGEGASIELPGMKTIQELELSQSGFKHISLPKVIELKRNAFQYCIYLESLELSDRLSKVQFDAFSGLPGGAFTDEGAATLIITMKSAPPKVCNGADSRGLVPLSIAKGITFRVPANQLKAYQTAPGWAQHADKIMAY